MKKIISTVLLLTLVLGFTAYAFDPGVYDMVIQAGEDYQLTLQLADSTGAAVNLSGNTYAAQFRSAPAPAGIVFATFSASSSAPLAGQVAVRLSKDQTVAHSGKTGVWDLRQTTGGGAVSYLISGKAVVRPTVTR
jgi:hypothetical protein